MIMQAAAIYTFLQGWAMAACGGQDWNLLLHEKSACTIM